MKTFYTCKCGSSEFVGLVKGRQTAMICAKCGAWLKWADKKEKRLLEYAGDLRKKRKV